MMAADGLIWCISNFRNLFLLPAEVFHGPANSGLCHSLVLSILYSANTALCALASLP
jgi:hypothetical protein